MYYRARYYDPALEVFISQGPLGDAQHYVGGNPLRMVDPLGLSVNDFFAGMMDLISGGLTSELRKKLYYAFGPINIYSEDYIGGQGAGIFALLHPEIRAFSVVSGSLRGVSAARNTVRLAQLYNSATVLSGASEESAATRAIVSHIKEFQEVVSLK